MSHAKGSPIARSPKPQEEQLALIEVDDPKYKEVKKKLTKYDAKISEHRENRAADKDEEKALRSEVLQAIKDADISPDGEGAYHIRMGGVVWNISQEAQLRVKKAKAPKDDAGDEDDPDE